MKLPIGIMPETTTASEDFKKNIQTGKRYVDKTLILVPLLRMSHETTFFLRPRRFGKTLALSMIKYFVEDTGDKRLNEENRSLFSGMKIMDAGEYYTDKMTSYPVIQLTMQTVKGDKYRDAYDSLRDVIKDLYQEKKYLLKKKTLDDIDKNFFIRILEDVDSNGKRATLSDYKRSLKKLSEFLRKTYGKRAVILIDEYDVPLENAYRKGFYEKMTSVVGPLLQNALKTNSDNLQFAVVTGCLRIAKEGIYTGLNNPEINTCFTRGENDLFGFTEAEVKNLLEESGFSDRFDEFEEWYDGYVFDLSKIYNPWSVIKHIEDLCRNPASEPMPHWAGTSENAIIREMAEYSDESTKEKIDKVMRGEEIEFSLCDNIVYDELYSNPDNVFNVLVSTGYLTATAFNGLNVTAKIPNKEVHKIFADKIQEWFRSTLGTFDIKGLYRALENGDAEQTEEMLTNEFLSAMSYYDSQEAFYHGILLTLMQLNNDFLCVSNRESGTGRFDILCKQKARRDLAIILEVKVSAEDKDMLRDAKKGAGQIKSKNYVSDIKREGYKEILCYGVAFCNKKCRIVQK
ncbi:MAG: ATP-binding protein [Lachnospiraceae bacterium]|nr:ATP-binding protein [Lachnospiraceae bacterium]